MAGCSGTPATPTADAGCDGACQTVGYGLTRIAGTLDVKGSADGQGSAARFHGLAGITGDAAWLYVTDRVNGLVRRIDRATFEVSTLAGGPTRAGHDRQPADGKGEMAVFRAPTAIALIKGHLFVLDDGALRTIELQSLEVGTLRSPTTQKPWKGLDAQGLAALGDLLYIADFTTIKVYDPSTKGLPTVAAGKWDDIRILDGPTASARFFSAQALAATPSGTLLIGDLCALREFDPKAQTVTTVAGTLTPTPDSACLPIYQDGTLLGASFVNVLAVAQRQDGPVVLDESDGSDLSFAMGYGVIRRVDRAGDAVATVAGSLPEAGHSPGAADSAALQARFFRPTGIFCDGAACFVTTPSALRRFDGAAVNTVAGRVAESDFIAPGAVLAGDGSGDVDLVLDGSTALVRLTATGQRKQLAAHKPDWLLLPGSVVARIGARIFVANRRMIGLHDTKTLESKVIKMVSAPGHGGLATDGAMVYFLRREKGVPSVLVIDGTTGATVESIPVAELTALHDLVHHEKALYLAGGAGVWRLDLGDRKLTRLAGHTDVTGCIDGPGDTARFGNAAGITVAAGALFIGDVGCATLRAIDLSTRQVTTPKLEVQATPGLLSPAHIATDGDNLLVSDSGRDMVFRLAPLQ